MRKTAIIIFSGSFWRGRDNIRGDVKYIVKIPAVSSVICDVIQLKLVSGTVLGIRFRREIVTGLGAKKGGHIIEVLIIYF